MLEPGHRYVDAQPGRRVGSQKLIERLEDFK